VSQSQHAPIVSAARTSGFIACVYARVDMFHQMWWRGRRLRKNDVDFVRCRIVCRCARQSVCAVRRDTRSWPSRICLIGC